MKNGVVKIMVYILAGSIKQANQYAKSKGIKPSEMVYVDSSDKLRGIEKGQELVCIGHWYTQPEIDDIMKVAINDRKMVLL